ncbi:SNARE associated Golgi protein [Artemisia annua]|uniref:SNARE associated Golgi protein n=1 Tax=Artemisia annua TaxID=35608 RepID=A0A2U1NZJ3_ARTAN|nr:SNARE associated Golgi protein [Artemisia annua]
MAGASSIILGLAIALIGVYVSLPDSDYSFLKLPRTLEDLRVLRSDDERIKNTGTNFPLNLHTKTIEVLKQEPSMVFTHNVL